MLDTTQDTETDPVLSAGPGAPPHALLGPGHPGNSSPLTRPRPPLPGLQVGPAHAFLDPGHLYHSFPLTSSYHFVADPDTDPQIRTSY
jgi:hypothetical protein